MEKEYNIKLSQATLQYIINVLQQRPWSEVNQIINDLVTQAKQEEQKNIKGEMNGNS